MSISSFSEKYQKYPTPVVIHGYMGVWVDGWVRGGDQNDPLMSSILTSKIWRLQIYVQSLFMPITSKVMSNLNLKFGKLKNNDCHETSLNDA